MLCSYWVHNTINNLCSCIMALTGLLSSTVQDYCLVMGIKNHKFKLV